MSLKVWQSNMATRGNSLAKILENRGMVEVDGVSIKVSCLTNFEDGSFVMEHSSSYFFVGYLSWLSGYSSFFIRNLSCFACSSWSITEQQCIVSKCVVRISVGYFLISEDVMSVQTSKQIVFKIEVTIERRL